MPQLKIQDVKQQVEDLEKKLDARLDSLIAEVKASVVSTKSENPGLKELVRTVEQLNNDLRGHIAVYNKHIMQQHAPKVRVR